MGLVLYDTSFVSPYLCWAAIVLSIPFWFLMYFYLDSVVPNTYGVQKHPLFCLRRANDVEERDTGNSTADEENPLRLRDQNKILNENDPIKIHKLTKVFGKFKAVDNLSLSIREGEIFTILGHNGAGKTTAIYMLTGVLKPTSGNAEMYGNSITD